ncbi:MAG: 2Fe-2S iron-sulfur cluster binding domain-containing protein [Magnetococcales bacterium]|nr:2Fe-2S iron-sulfur cluster binding domain-containing protein [Magnetococcales bacterium]
MPKITFKPLNETIEVHSGQTLLEACHDHNVPLEGACEGSLACSTCHVIVAPAWYHKLPPASDEEEDILDKAWGVTTTSRLGCQIEITDDLDGLEVTIPEHSINFDASKKGGSR